MKTLECSSKGDKRFSAFYAKTFFDGEYNSIENFYQGCKRFGNDNPVSFKQAKGKRPTHIIINGVKMDLHNLTPFYNILWVTYLDTHPELVAFASEYDKFTDMFKRRNTRNCQADVISRYIKEGRNVLVEECKVFLNEYYEKKKAL